MGLSAWRAGIGDFLDALNEMGKRIVGKHENLRGKKEMGTEVLRRRKVFVGKKFANTNEIRKIRQPKENLQTD